MTAWTAFDTMSWSLLTLATCAVIALLKSFGFFRWLRQWWWG